MGFFVQWTIYLMVNPIRYLINAAPGTLLNQGTTINSHPNENHQDSHVNYIILWLHMIAVSALFHTQSTYKYVFMDINPLNT